MKATIPIHNQNKLLISYFVLQLSYGLFITLILGISAYPISFVFYLISGPPVYFIIYNSCNYTLTYELKYNYHTIYDQYGFRNPFTNEIRNMFPTIFFNRNIPINDMNILGRIKLGKRSLVFTLISFISFPTLAILSYYI